MLTFIIVVFTSIYIKFSLGVKLLMFLVSLIQSVSKTTPHGWIKKRPPGHRHVHGLPPLLYRRYKSTVVLCLVVDLFCLFAYLCCCFTSFCRRFMSPCSCVPSFCCSFACLYSLYICSHLASRLLLLVFVSSLRSSFHFSSFCLCGHFFT